MENRVVYVDNEEKNGLVDPPFPTNAITNTKYTIYTFLPLSILEQFSQHMNRYFILIAILQLWPLITPVDPITTWGPLLMILGISMTKEGIDDYGRYKADKRANERVVQLVRGRTVLKVPCHSIRVGDIVKVEEDEEFPCDLLLLKSSNPNGECYIQTTNIDGETNLKKVHVPTQLLGLGDTNLQSRDAYVTCDQPNSSIYSFDATLTLNDDHKSHSTIALTSQNLLLQATHLRHTEWIYGAAIYTGNQSKVGQNKNIPKKKWTVLDGKINKTTVCIFSFQIFLVILLGSLGNVRNNSNKHDLWYVYPDSSDEHWYDPIVIPLRFLLLSSMMIPISLKVSMDITKLCYSLFINWDLRMYDQENDTPAHAANTAISEDLGQIEYVLTDKTGTLTVNQMIFRKCAINGVLFGEVSPILSDADLLARLKLEDDNVVSFFRCFALCNTAVPKIRQPKVTIEPASPTPPSPSRDGSLGTNSSSPSSNLPRAESMPMGRIASKPSIEYSASSPDEEALVGSAHQLGISFQSRENDKLQISVSGKLETYDLLQTLEFSSSRKRMSVILRSTSDELIMYTKGADDVIFARLDQKERKSSDDFYQSALDQYSRKGLRTLCFAFRKLGEEEYKSWSVKWEHANKLIQGRKEALEAVYEEIENNLTLIGVSGIEDKLQEDVDLTIQRLRRAGIKVWMLTGDKYQTAFEISKASALIAPTDHVLTINGYSREDVGQSLEKSFVVIGPDNKALRDYVLVVEGAALALALEHFQSQFMILGMQALTVVCCRVTPSQKAAVVKLVKDQGKITLAIGDGGNDVAMIQEANIGVGIAGREGLQAARAADYSFGRFSFLSRLCLIHGRYSYNRTAFLAKYSFYKSLFICLIQLIFSGFSSYSGSSFFDSFSLMSYNVFYTSLPVLSCIFFKDIDENVLLADPALYKTSQAGSQFTPLIMLFWICRAVVDASIVVSVITKTDNGTAAIALGNKEYLSTGLSAYTICVLLQCFVIFLATPNFTKYNHILIWGLVPVFIILNSILAAMPFSELYGVAFQLWGDPVFYLRLFFTLTCCILPHVVLRYFTTWVYPDPVQNALRNQKERNSPYNDLSPPASNSSDGESRSFLLEGAQTNASGRLDAGYVELPGAENTSIT